MSAVEGWAWTVALVALILIVPGRAIRWVLLLAIAGPLLGLAALFL